VHRPPVHADGERVHDGRTPWAQVRRPRPQSSLASPSRPILEG
jgi:hypothetical protein